MNFEKLKQIITYKVTDFLFPIPSPDHDLNFLKFAVQAHL